MHTDLNQKKNDNMFKKTSVRYLHEKKILKKKIQFKFCSMLLNLFHSFI